ncbi:MAG: hypothetical protein KBF63_19250 [Rhodoferax sp.]|nr:hypothetical protein [Rhodoferax sp.]MBP9931419.1 hypothetical protein [Rhodoferax sp.]HQX61137.1 hypothetical protein [Burkholderiaceae bacterium]HQZ05887.1 hypothetical protein [Burkholderiaceae bacterium]HRA61912.1 hypothetical protein [Burkholderiaceae bacterium]
MAKYAGTISALGDYATITTTQVTRDAHGNERVGFFDKQQERYIDGLQIGQQRFGRMSCPENIYQRLETGRQTRLYTWLHPFLGPKPIRVGIVGVAYPSEGELHVMSFKQLLLSLLMLACLPLLWLIPAIIVASVFQWVFGLGERATAAVVFLVAAAPWFAAVNLTWNYWRARNGR